MALRSRASSREAAVKASLTANLIEYIKEVQLKHANLGGKLTTEEETNELCTVLEAIFVHGLKDTLMKRVSSALGGDHPDRRMPEPDFWSPLMVFSHKDVMEQIACYTRIVTDIGRCRAWLRLALNEGLMSSYLAAMHKDKSTLKDYYSKHAYLRDSEHFDIMRTYLVGVEEYEFQLACNSSVLNSWTSSPLALAGLWIPPMARPAAVVQGVDAIEVLGEEVPAFPSFVRPEPMPYVARTPVLNEDEALRVILAPRQEEEEDPEPAAMKGARRKVRRRKIVLKEPPDDVNVPKPETVAKTVEELPKLVVDDVALKSNTESELEGDPEPKLEETKPTDITSSNGVVSDGTDVSPNEPKDESEESGVGNSLGGRLGWSSSFEEDQEECSELSTSTISRQSSEPESFQSLLQNYSPLTKPIPRSANPDFEVVCPAANDTPAAHSKEEEEEIIRSPTSPGSDFEIIRHAHLEYNMSQLRRIATEQGLDSQNYECKSCGRPIGMIYGKPRVCSFSGHYFCYECHENEESEIPARIVHNWDFQRHPVSRGALRFLSQVEHEPLLNIMEINPILYHVIEEMNELQSLRTQLNFLRAYLYTCREPVIEELRHRVWPREYLCEHVHLYSLSDLLTAPTRELAHKLQKVVAFARSHVASCCTCNPKGFICEVCDNPQIIYPFDLSTTYRCPTCCAVFHRNCLDSAKPCPKCERRKKRQDPLELP